MTRDINFNKPLSKEDEQYVIQRPWLIGEAEQAGITVRYASAGAVDEDEESDYTRLTIAELKEEIDRRNEDRPEEEQIDVPSSAKKGALIAALEEDDDLEEG